MFAFLPPLARGAIAASLLVLNTLAWCGLLFLFALVKLVVPGKRVRTFVDRVLNRIATQWIAGNSAWMRLTQRTHWDVAGFDDLPYRGWYILNCNHQSWVDVLVLQRLLNHRIPMLKFFLKQQLLYVPVMGLAWWALDFPFMRRHSAAALEQHPERRLDDIEAARRACDRFSLVPTSVMNFAEGTRFTQHKHRSQRSPYRHLLKPKAGALALAIGVLGDRFDALLDITIVYPDGAPTFWQFLCGNVRRVVARAHWMSIPPAIRHGDYTRDPNYRKTVEGWLQGIWREKDERIDALLAMRVAPRYPNALTSGSSR